MNIPNLDINGDITSVGTLQQVKKCLAMLNGAPLECRLFSYGGEALAGLAIHDLIKQYHGKTSVIIDAAFSAGALIAMAFQERKISENGFLMLHGSWNDSEDDTSEHDAFLHRIDDKQVGIFVGATGKSEEYIRSLLEAETFLDSLQCVASGFCHSVVDATQRGTQRIAAAMRNHAKLKSQETPCEQWKRIFDSYCKTMKPEKAVAKIDKEFPKLRERMLAVANLERQIEDTKWRNT